MLKGYRFTPAARADIEEIWNHTVSNWSFDQAQNYVRAIQEICVLIVSQPHLARERNEISPPVRIHAHGKHLIIYRIERDYIDVVRIVHSRQNWSVLLGE